MSENREDVALAIETLRAVATDPKAGSGAKVQAARTLLEVQRVLGPRAPVAPPDGAREKPVGSLSKSEIERELGALKSKTH